MKPEKRAKLQAACDTISRLRRERFEPAAIVETLVSDHRASFRDQWNGQRLSIAGVASTCTYGVHGVLANWEKLATVKLMELNFHD